MVEAKRREGLEDCIIISRGLHTLSMSKYSQRVGREGRREGVVSYVYGKLGAQEG